MVEMEEQKSENPTAEEVRQRRLAYFQSLSGKDSAVQQNETKLKEEIQLEKAKRNEGKASENKPRLDEYENLHQTSQENKEQVFVKKPIQIPHLELDKQKSSDEAGYNPEVERLIQMTKQEMAEKFKDRHESSPKEVTPPSSSAVREPSRRTFQDLKPQVSNDLHVEDIFSDRNSSSRVRQSKRMATSLKDSQDNMALGMFQKSVDATQAEELGLSTHRPEEGSKLQERSPRALDESMSEELKYALGERKYQEFLEKSMKDIDALYGENMKNNNMNKLSTEKGIKDINLKRDQHDKITDRRVNETDDSHRPLLNRPKHEPSSIYQNKQDTTERETHFVRSKSVENKNSNSSRNFAFSADEIYSQAYQPQIKSQPVSISTNAGIGHGHPVNVQGSIVSGVGHSHAFPQEFQSHPQFYHSQSYESSFGQHQPEYLMAPNSPGNFVQHPYGSPESYNPHVRTPRVIPYSPTSKGDGTHFGYPMMHHSYPHFEEGHSHPTSARHIHLMDPGEIYKFKQQHPQMFPHPPGEQMYSHYGHSPKSHPPMPKVSQSMPFFHQGMPRLPHPPESPSSRPGNHGDMSAFQDYLHMMPKGIPYPPPPSEIELQTYFQYLGSQGYPIPYQSVMPPDSPRDDTGMIPHPPAERKDNRPGSGHFRRRDSQSSPGRREDHRPGAGYRGRGKSPDRPVMERREDGSSSDTNKMESMKRTVDDNKPEELNSSQRHIDGIRQFHEQRRQQQENEMLEKQRTFAKESIDRYFSSLQHHSSKHNTDIKDKSMEILRESLTDVQTMVNSEATGVTLNAGGITERMDELGIDLSYMKGKDEGSDKAYKTKGERSRNVIVCPECGEINKPYMTWCSECSEVLIGVDPVKVKPKRKSSKSKNSGESNNDKNYVLYKNVTFDEKNKRNELNNEQEELNEQNEGTARLRLKSSPCKSEGRDSGRPSSEDIDFTRTENEIDEICQSLGDPVIKGFIKAYFNKKRNEMGKRNIKVLDSNRELPSAEYSGSVNEEMKESQEQYEDVEDNEDQFSEQEDQTFDNRYPENFVRNEFEIESHPIDDIPPPVESHSPVNFEHHPHLHDEETWLHERRMENMQAPLGKKHLPIDIEVFTLEESKQGKSSKSDPLVPSLNLANSSDEDEVSRQQKKPFVPLSMSAESEDWQDFFHNENERFHLEEEQVPESPIGGEDESSKPFLAQLLDHHPKISKRPPSTSSKTKKSSQNVKSVVKESIDAPLRQRKWAKSSIAWNSYNQRELSTKSSIGLAKSRPSSAGTKRPSSGVSKSVAVTRPVDVPQRSGSMHNLSLALGEEASSARNKGSKISTPVNTDLSSRSDNEKKFSPLNRNSPDRTTKKKEDSLVRRKEMSLAEKKPVESPKSLPYVIDHRLPAEDIEPVKDIGKLQNAYSMYQEMTPRIQEGKFSAWLCLPDEIMLQIFSFLSHSDLISVGLTCKRYFRVALDETLWRYITVKKRHEMDDDTLVQIGHRHPVSLALIQCHGDNITAKGLREMFRECCDTLRELNLCGCSRGALTGDCILLHASARCHNLTHVDASWCMVTDSGIGAISSSCKRLESLCINGCQNITDEGLENVIKKHGASLRVLEMFGCFKITPKGIRYLATHCVNLLTLNLGQCYKLKDSCISQLSASLGRVECLDLRGVKQIKDNCIRYVVKNCPRLKTIVMANCPNISDVSILEISTYLSDIRVIDVCGCRNITDNSIRALSNNCQNLRNIDISSTGCSHRSVSMLANFCNQRLEEAKLNFLSDVSDAVVSKLVKHCKRLKLLHLYGCSNVKDLKKIQDINPNLRIEM